MKYTFTGKSLEEVVKNTFRPTLEQKYLNESATISAGRSDYSYEAFYLDVERGQRISVTWDAADPADEDVYGINISSNSGSYRGAFGRAGRWSFIANRTGEMELNVGVSYVPGYFIYAPRVTITVSG